MSFIGLLTTVIISSVLSASVAYVLGRRGLRSVLTGRWPLTDERWLEQRCWGLNEKNEENERLLSQLKRSQQVSADVHRELRVALEELLKRGTFEEPFCGCGHGYSCAKCLACKALGWGKYRGPRWVESKLQESRSERARG